MRWLWTRQRVEDQGADILDVEQFEMEMEKRAITMLGMSLVEFRRRAGAGDLPETPAVDHLRFLLGV